MEHIRDEKQTSEMSHEEGLYTTCIIPFSLPTARTLIYGISDTESRTSTRERRKRDSLRSTV